MVCDNAKNLFVRIYLKLYLFDTNYTNKVLFQVSKNENLIATRFN